MPRRWAFLTSVKEWLKDFKSGAAQESDLQAAQGPVPLDSACRLTDNEAPRQLTTSQHATLTPKCTSLPHEPSTRCSSDPLQFPRLQAGGQAAAATREGDMRRVTSYDACGTAGGSMQESYSHASPSSFPIGTASTRHSRRLAPHSVLPMPGDAVAATPAPLPDNLFPRISLNTIKPAGPSEQEGSGREGSPRTAATTPLPCVSEASLRMQQRFGPRLAGSKCARLLAGSKLLQVASGSSHSGLCSGTSRHRYSHDTSSSLLHSSVSGPLTDSLPGSSHSMSDSLAAAAQKHHFRSDRLHGSPSLESNSDSLIAEAAAASQGGLHAQLSAPFGSRAQARRCSISAAVSLDAATTLFQNLGGRRNRRRQLSAAPLEDGLSGTAQVAAQPQPPAAGRRGRPPVPTSRASSLEPCARGAAPACGAVPFKLMHAGLSADSARTDSMDNCSLFSSDGAPLAT